MNNTETFTCNECGKAKPRREGRIWDRWVGVCRACRHREKTRMYMQCRRETKKIKEMSDVRDTLLTNKIAAADIERKLALVRSWFLKATAVTRTRIREMERIENPGPRTQKALAVRRALLNKYEVAYELQQAAVRAGKKIEAIDDMIQA